MGVSGLREMCTLLHHQAKVISLRQEQFITLLGEIITLPTCQLITLSDDVIIILSGSYYIVRPLLHLQAVITLSVVTNAPVFASWRFQLIAPV